MLVKVPLQSGPWEYRCVWEMASELGFIDRHVLDADYFFVFLELNNAVYQQKGVSMR